MRNGYDLLLRFVGSFGVAWRQQRMQRRWRRLLARGRAEAPEPAAPAPAPLGMSSRCPFCDRRSYHPRDIAERFCGVCGFIDDLPLVARLPRHSGGRVG